MKLTRICWSQFVGNYWKRYVQRKMREVNGYDKYVPLAGWKVIRNKNWRYNQYRPWETIGMAYNNVKREFIPVEPIKRWNIFKGDRVQVMVGKDAGKQGIVDMVIKERNWCYVQGLNCDYREVTAEKVNDPRYPSTLYAIEKPLLVTTEVKLVDPEDNFPTEVDWRFSEDGEEVRVSRRTGRIIGFPMEYETLTEGDFVNIKSYQANKIADTPDAELLKVTFKPTLATFEQDLMKKFDIKEDRKKPRTYWY